MQEHEDSTVDNHGDKAQADTFRPPVTGQDEQRIFLAPGIEDYLRQQSGGQFTYAQHRLVRAADVAVVPPPGTVFVDDFAILPDQPSLAPRILITGSRDWTDKAIIGNALLQWWLANDRPTATLVHGGARGADTLAAEVWNRSKFPVEVHNADWSMGRRAGRVRNEQMVRLGASVCLAFIRNNSKGATHCAGLALNAGIPTIVYRVDDQPDVVKRSLLPWP